MDSTFPTQVEVVEALDELQLDIRTMRFVGGETSHNYDIVIGLQVVPNKGWSLHWNDPGYGAYDMGSRIGYWGHGFMSLNASRAELASVAQKLIDNAKRDQQELASGRKRIIRSKVMRRK